MLELNELHSQYVFREFRKDFCVLHNGTVEMCNNFDLCGVEFQ